MIPVIILTGFLGSGKTTLLSCLLKLPELARTAVIINEFGEIGLDHELLASSEEAIVELETGCLCCVVRGDLALTLADLLQRRDQGEVPAFERIVVETSGLADPAPILQLLMTDATLAARLTISATVTTVDAELGQTTLEQEPLSVKQVAIADTIVVTKSDRTNGVTEALTARLDDINPTAKRIMVTYGVGADADLLTTPDRAHEDPIRWLSLPADMQTLPTSPLHGDVSTFAFVRDQPVSAVALVLFLETLAEHCGRDMLRMKGLVCLSEIPDRPAIIHGVQHIFQAPEFLVRWPSDDQRTRIVFISRGIRRAWIEALLEAIESEVSAAID